ncbi:hypothetical protein ACHAXT_008622 [Thalassiosira profunda]
MNIISPVRKALIFLAAPSVSSAPLFSLRGASTCHLAAAFHFHASSSNLRLTFPSGHNLSTVQSSRSPYTTSFATPSVFQTMSTSTSRAASAAASDGEDAESKASAPLKGSEAAGSATKKAAKKKGASSKKKKASPKKKAGKAKAASDDEDAKPKAKKKAAPKKRKSKSPSASDDESPAAKKSPKKKKAATDHQRWTERVPIARHWDAEKALNTDGSYTFTIISWNVAGLRAFVKKQPVALKDLAERYQADVICLQEHKLQDGMLDDPKLKLREHFEEKLPDFEGHWSYSLEKKGYSGVAMLIRNRGKKGGDGKKKQATLGAFFGGKSDGTTKGDNVPTGDVPVANLVPVKVETELSLPAHDGEGRVVTAEFPLFSLTGVYVPNSGQKLDRLGYRTTEWDTDFLAKMQQLEKDKPVIWLGDLNVAHNEKDTWNEGAKHLAKSAGTTAEERASFERQLGGGFVDAFRHLHPEGKGHYSYWSQRAGNREPNKGLRLDYFICSEGLMTDEAGKKVVVRDSYMLPECQGSDHCPIVLELEIKK